MPIQSHTATIPAGEAISNAVDCTGGYIIKIATPPDWYRSPVTFQISNDNVTFFDAFLQNGEEIQFVIEANAVIICVKQLSGWIKLRSGTRERPLAQPAARDFIVVVDTGLS